MQLRGGFLSLGLLEMKIFKQLLLSISLTMLLAGTAVVAVAQDTVLDSAL
ncbi:MAG: hypothetical protein IPJ07_12010 [Acidobacteria bacterium]|nr:hypothetical protein [Acidobacteriota bacterium]